jgi:hypothetical protein
MGVRQTGDTVPRARQPRPRPGVVVRRGAPAGERDGVGLRSRHPPLHTAGDAQRRQTRPALLERITVVWTLLGIMENHS